MNLQTQGVTVVTNGSNDGLLDAYLDPAVGCTPFTAPDLSNPVATGTSQALNELQAAADQQAPIALVPVNDPMTEVNGAASIAKTNLYRAGVGQPALPAGTDLNQHAKQYCANLLTIQVASLQADAAAFVGGPTPDPGAGNNLFTFLAARLSGSYDNLDCAQYGLANPVHLITDENGATTGATFGGTVPATPSRAPSGTGTATASPTAPGSPAPTSAPPASTSPASAPPSESATPTGAAAQ